MSTASVTLPVPSSRGTVPMNWSLNVGVSCACAAPHVTKTEAKTRNRRNADMRGLSSPPVQRRLIVVIANREAQRPQERSGRNEGNTKPLLSCLLCALCVLCDLCAFPSLVDLDTHLPVDPDRPTVHAL